METTFTGLLHNALVRPKILIVDDQIINIRLVGEIFKDDFEVFMATTGEQAVAQCQQIVPDLILLDVVMPGLDGHEVCRRLQADEQTRQIPIIFVTSKIDELEEAYGFELGAVDYVTKPYNQTILKARVRTHLLLKFQADQLRSNERFMRTLTDNIPGLIGYWDANMRSRFANAGYLSYFGKSTAQMAKISIRELLGDALFAKHEPMITAALRGEHQQFERILKKADGTSAFTWIQYVPDLHEGRVQGFFVLVSDVTNLKQTEAKLEESEQFARTAIDTVPDTICVVNKTGTIIAVNQAWRDLYDASPEPMLSKDYAIGANYIHACETAIGARAEDVKSMSQGLDSVLTGACDEFSLEYPCNSPTGKRFFFARVKRFPGDSGNVLIAHSNITERKTIELDLARLAHSDALTGLNNRRHFLQLSDTELSRVLRHGGSLSVLMLDIDYFKRVNDTYGHQVGDKVIQTLALVCKAQVRDLDVIGRLGGEEFAVTMPNANCDQAIIVAERLRKAIEDASVPLENGLTLNITASIGVSTQTDQSENLDTLLNRADQALYEAKNNGRNQVRSFVGE